MRFKSLLPQEPKIDNIILDDVDFDWDVMKLKGKTQFGEMEIEYQKEKDSDWLKIKKNCF